MAPLPIIPSCTRVALNWVTSTGLNATNVMHFLGGDGPEDLIEKLLDSAEDPGPNMFGTVASTARVDTVVATPLDGESASVTYTVPSGTSLVGTAPADFNPQVAAIVKLTTMKRGRSYRGRIFLPFVSEGAQANGVIPGDTVTVDNAAWEDFFENMIGHGYLPCVASYKLSEATVVTTVAFESKTATQRRRQKR